MVKPGERDEEQLRQSSWLAWLLDSSIRLPGDYRIGLDGLLGLIPGAGDLLGGGLSGWIVYRGYGEGVPRTILARMIINVLLDTALGAIPLLGDLFDFFWKANLRNVRLLEHYRRSPRQTYRRSALETAGFISLLVIAIVLIAAAAIWLVAALVEAIKQ